MGSEYPDHVPAEHEHYDEYGNRITHEHAYGMGDHAHNVTTTDTPDRGRLGTT